MLKITKYARWQLFDKNIIQPTSFIPGYTDCDICGSVITPGDTATALHYPPVSFAVYHDDCRDKCEAIITETKEAILKTHLLRLIAIAPLWNAVLCRDVVAQIVAHLVESGSLHAQVLCDVIESSIAHLFFCRERWSFFPLTKTESSHHKKPMLPTYSNWVLTYGDPTIATQGVISTRRCIFCNERGYSYQGNKDPVLVYHIRPDYTIALHMNCKETCENTVSRLTEQMQKQYVDKLIAISPLWNGALYRDIIAQIVAAFVGPKSFYIQILEKSAAQVRLKRAPRLL